MGGYDCLGKMVGVTVVIKVVVEVVMEEAAEAVQVDFSVFYGVHVLKIWWVQKYGVDVVEVANSVGSVGGSGARNRGNAVVSGGRNVGVGGGVR